MTLVQYINERKRQFETGMLSTSPRQRVYGRLRNGYGMPCVMRHLTWIEAILEAADKVAWEAARNGNGRNGQTD